MYSIEQIKELIATGNKKKIYDDRYWRDYLSPKILKRDNYECQECKKEGKLTIKEHRKKLDIHHIKEIEKYPELTYDENNLETVCIHHHNILDNKNQFNNTNKKKFINEERW
ncbi:MAG: HNH endonuclease [Clostridia bacterium]|nr:HNH endonuclease [Clostridia bacterium]